MKNSAYILLVIGVLGIIASVINYISGDSLSSTVLSLICSVSLIFGYTELKKLGK